MTSMAEASSTAPAGTSAALAFGGWLIFCAQSREEGQILGARSETRRHGEERQIVTRARARALPHMHAHHHHSADSKQEEGADTENQRELVSAR